MDQVEALVIAYKKAVIPLEAEILIQGLKVPFVNVLFFSVRFSMAKNCGPSFDFRTASQLQESEATAEDHLDKGIEVLFQKLLEFKDISAEITERIAVRRGSTDSMVEKEGFFVTDRELALHLQGQGLPDPDKDYLRLFLDVHDCCR
jgi:hypothetical protein